MLDGIQVGVIGGGMMGHGIALHCAVAGVPVSLTDTDERHLEESRRWIEKDAERLAKFGLASPEAARAGLGRISYVPDFGRAVSGSQFIFEAVFEDLAVKQDVLRAADSLGREDAVLASTTSSLRVEELAGAVRDPGRVIGTHWTNPPHIMPLVEVVLGPKTDRHAHSKTLAFLRDIGKTPVTCKDIPGYIVNRLQYAMLNEAISLVEKEIATPEDVDEAVRNGFGIRLACKGPFEWNDLLHDVDITLRIFENLFAAEGNPKFKPSRLLHERITRGEMGLSTGKGWRDYQGRSSDELLEERDTVVMKMIRSLREMGIISDRSGRLPQDSSAMGG